MTCPHAPGVAELDELIRRGLAATNDPRTVVTDSRAPYFGTELPDITLLPDPDAHLTETRFADRLTQRQ